LSPSPALQRPEKQRGERSERSGRRKTLQLMLVPEIRRLLKDKETPQKRALNSSDA